ncbi:CCR4-NOT transcription complex subunit 6-like isoform X2 [Varroa jacobsoni]|uniref:poly(A)-specific ribonuclease n=1 Tax=Varroa destructor TaxID=109461 RepID=A0A7M7KW73_VARDE|nr:CCR4-NOT transcription complex subunit 6-like isoform X2 [Varroa destructor]XP_022672629.1 CCR4-NOT transcription complex subunit 6-like isoform X2 [Varroa destructor]XP_022672630.1 CCR4-NOT transcription complex subunit 6-like isoform X2 [Varroa destructor]XP_022672631.1 CCR4-NOT transcription complex subunit 6-like isoform X2 [Varroa destructor]XP_022702694.1 CCR4-NOT transcription complex subunit 6-like isoform X2 [Varroa jacobsoni]
MSSAGGYHHSQYYHGRSPITARNRSFVVHDDQRMSRLYGVSGMGGRNLARDKDGPGNNKLDNQAGGNKFDSGGVSLPRRNHTFMQADDLQSGKKSKWTELEIKGFVRNISPSLWQFTHLTALYLNDNGLQRLPVDICRLVHLAVLDVSTNKLRSLPNELGDLVQLRELLLNNNLLHSLPYELGRLFQLITLGLKGNPLSPDILSLYSEPNGTQKLLTYLLDSLPASQSGAPTRHWLRKTVDPPQGKSVFTQLTVMCYNVLCDKYATRTMYGYCPSWALTWEYRRKGIMEEIRSNSADIITLQEVETEQFYNYFEPELKHEGWEGIFSPKSRAKSMPETDRKHVDGCAIFYKTSKFSVLDKHLIEFNQLAMANAEGSDDMLNRVMTKDNISLAVLLQLKEHPDVPVLVCTAHIHWDPEYCDVKLIQTMMLMNELQTIHEKSKALAKTTDIPIILTGDLNSLPDSGVIEYLRNGRIACDHPDFKELNSYRSCLKKMTVDSNSQLGANSYTHPFQLEQGYTENDMPYTNYTYDFQGMIDYIFFTKKQITVAGILGPLDPEWLAENKVIGCPHQEIPSDHIPLVAQLQLFK